MKGQTSGRPDNPGRAGPPFFKPVLINLSEPNEGGTIHERTEAADRVRGVRGHSVERTASQVEDLLSEHAGGGGVRT